MEPTECIDIMKASRQRFQFEHELEYIAIMNALGAVFSKNYRYKDIFKENKAKKEVTEEEREDMKKFLENW